MRPQSFDPSKIILVDDDPLEAQLVKLAFQRTGIQAEFVYLDSGMKLMDYLDMVPSRDIALLLLDLKMPLMDGTEVLRMFNERGYTRFPIVMFSSSSHPDDIATCYRLGACGYVTKPIHQEEWQDSIRKVGEFWVGVNQKNPS